jgi:hypothetical protein
MEAGLKAAIDAWISTTLKNVRFRSGNCGSTFSGGMGTRPVCLFLGNLPSFRFRHCFRFRQPAELASRRAEPCVRTPFGRMRRECFCCECSLHRIRRNATKVRTTGRTILFSLAVRLPAVLRRKSGNALKMELASANALEIALYTGSTATSATRWPQSGWILEGFVRSCARRTERTPRHRWTLLGCQPVGLADRFFHAQLTVS